MSLENAPTTPKLKHIPANTSYVLVQIVSSAKSYPPCEGEIRRKMLFSRGYCQIILTRTKGRDAPSLADESEGGCCTFDDLGLRPPHADHVRDLTQQVPTTDRLDFMVGMRCCASDDLPCFKLYISMTPINPWLLLFSPA